MSESDPTEAQILDGLTRVGMPPDTHRLGRPEWFNDYGGGALADAYRAGWRDAQSGSAQSAPDPLDGAGSGFPEALMTRLLELAWLGLRESEREKTDRPTFERSHRQMLMSMDALQPKAFVFSPQAEERLRSMSGSGKSALAVAASEAISAGEGHWVPLSAGPQKGEAAP